MTRTWRGCAARVNFYFNEGNAALVQIKQVIYVCAALTLLGMSMGVALAMAPAVYLLHVGMGYVWIRYGWYRQLAEVPATDATNPLLIWQTTILLRLCEAVGVRTEAIDLGTVPPAMRNELTSFRGRGRG